MAAAKQEGSWPRVVAHLRDREPSRAKIRGRQCQKTMMTSVVSVVSREQTKCPILYCGLENKAQAQSVSMRSVKMLSVGERTHS